MRQEAVIPEQQTAIEDGDPLQMFADTLYAIDGLTIAPDYIALRIPDDIPEVHNVLILDTTGRFGILHILDTEKDCIGCNHRINNINRPATDGEIEQTITFAQQLHRIKSNTPELSQQRYNQAIGAVRQLLREDKKAAQKDRKPFDQRINTASQGLKTIRSL